MSHYTILLVDDSPNILKALQRTLRGDGYEMFPAGSAEDALKVLETEAVDLIITDQNMPGVSGTELLREVRQRYPEVIRFMLTGITDIEVAKAAINAGEVYRFFNKPWDDFELQVSVRRALEHRAVSRENVRLFSLVKSQEDQLRQLERTHPGITHKEMTSDGAIVIED